MPLKAPALAALFCTLILGVGWSPAAPAGETGALFTEKDDDFGEAPPPARRPAREEAGRKRWGLSFDLHYRARDIHPTKVKDKYTDNVGGVSYSESLEMDVYDSSDRFRETTLGLTLHWYPKREWDVFFSLRRPVYGKGQHRSIEYDGVPIASPTVNFDGFNIELATGARWEAFRVREGFFRHFGVNLLSEARFGWANEAEVTELHEFNADSNDDLDFDASWQGFDAEVQLFRAFPFTRIGGSAGGMMLTAGVGLSLFFYQEKWDGDFEDGEEEEEMEFEYREDNPFYGSVGFRLDVPRAIFDVSGRYGGEFLLHIALGYKF